MNTTVNDIDAGGRRYLADLPSRDRSELLSDISDAIAELGEAAASDYDLLVARLGPPVEFAREIRRSAGGGTGLGGGAVDAGLPPATATPVPAAPAEPPRILQAGSRALRWTGRTLEPLWWLLRAFAIVVVLAFFFRGSSSSGFLGGVAIAVLVASVVHGAHVRRDRSADSPSTELARGAGILISGFVALWFLFVMAVSVPFSSVRTTSYDGPAPSPNLGMSAVLVGPQGPIENIYAFDADGNRLRDVRLYDQNGEAISIGEFADEPERRTPVDVRNAAAYNAFPVRYFDPGTRVVADPDAGWPASPPPLSGKVKPALTPGASGDPEEPVVGPVPDTLPLSGSVASSPDPASPGPKASGSAVARGAALAAK